MVSACDASRGSNSNDVAYRETRHRHSHDESHAIAAAPLTPTRVSLPPHGPMQPHAAAQTKRKSNMWVVGVGMTTHVALNTLRIRIRKRVDALKICEALNPKP